MRRRGRSCWHTPEEKAAFAHEKNERYLELLRTLPTVAVPDQTRSLLSTLRQRGYRLAVGSSSKNARAILDRIGLTAYFDAISDGTGISRSKPDPEVFFNAADLVGVEPSACIVIEDARSGVMAARCVGMSVICIGDAATHRLGDTNIQTLTDLFTIL